MLLLILVLVSGALLWSVVPDSVDLVQLTPASLSGVLPVQSLLPFSVLLLLLDSTSGMLVGMRSMIAVCRTTSGSPGRLGCRNANTRLRGHTKQQ